VLASKFCSECGAQLIKSSSFCVRCGTKVSSPSQFPESSKPSQDQLQKVEAFEVSNNENFSKVIVTRKTSNSFFALIKSSNLLKVSLALLLLLILAATLFLISPKSSKEINANSMTARQLMTFLIDKGYCSQEWKIDYSEKSDKLAYKSDLIRTCELSSANYVENTKLNSILSLSAPMTIDIAVGDARLQFQVNEEITIVKNVDSVIGANWQISFDTNESRFPGVFDDGKRYMLEIAALLKGETAKNMQPSDECIYAVNNFKTEEDLYQWEIDEYIDCTKYFPASLDLKYFPDWID
jgi:hypothetical protein